MRILCRKQPLVEAITNVSRAVSSKNTQPALEGILIKAKNNTLSLTGYDMDQAISTVIEAETPEEGEIVLSAHIFLDMIRRMPCESISINSDAKLLTLVKGDLTEYTILGIPAEDFPELPSISQGTSIEIGQLLLKSMISQTIFAVATGDSKPIHTGSLFHIQEKELHVVSVDGYRLALRREQVSIEDSFTFIVPGKSLTEVSKLLKDEEGTLSIEVSKRHILFHIGNYHLISRLLEGDFLDYKAAIPTGGDTQIRIGTRELISAIERASLLISDNIKSPLRMRFKDSIVYISCATALGKVYDEISCVQTGKEVEIGFNSRYMLDALKATECDEVKLLITGPFSPIKLEPIEGNAFTFLVLPVRLKAE